MQNKILKYLLIALVIAFIVPQIAMASWWNPFSWNWNNAWKAIINRMTPNIEPINNIINNHPENNSNIDNPSGVNSDSSNTDYNKELSKVENLDCAGLTSYLKKYSDEANHCTTGSDCITLYDAFNYINGKAACFLENPYLLVNKSTDSSIKNIIGVASDMYETKCSQCTYDYIPKIYSIAEKENADKQLLSHVSCVNKKCLITSSSVTTNSSEPAKVTIKNILENYKAYATEQKIVIVEGKNGGWGEVECSTNGVALGMITQSDTLIYDDTGCIYVKGGLYPGMTQEYLNKRVKIEATVVLDEKGRPALTVKALIYKEAQ
jgi:hypothetical protein